MARISSDAILSAADRWHIMKNLGDAVERSLARRHPALRAPAEAVLRAEQERLALLLAVAAVGAPPDPLLDAFPSAPLERATGDREIGRTRRQARYDEVQALRRDGLSRAAVARRLHLTRTTVRKLVHAPECPTSAPRPQLLLLQGPLLSPAPST